MRPAGDADHDELSCRNPLDLNNLPEEYGRDGKQAVLEETTSTATITESAASDTIRSSSSRKKSRGGANKRVDGMSKEEIGKVYECRFCSLKFCKSQALGGHMNRHRQERETEELNRARQLVFSNENFAAAQTTCHQYPHHIAPGLRDPSLGGARAFPSGNFHQGSSHIGGGGGGGGDPSLPFRSIYPTTRLFPAANSSTILPHPPPLRPPAPLVPQHHHHQPLLYSSSSPPSRLVSFPSQYPPPHHLINSYLVNRSVGDTESNYTCIGAPVGHNFPHHHDDITRRGGIGMSVSSSAPISRSSLDGPSQNQEDGLNWKPTYPSRSSHLQQQQQHQQQQQQQQQNLDPVASTSMMNRF